MNTTDILTKIKALLGVDEVEVNLESMKLEDGITIVESENFAEGEEIVIVTEDGKVAMPVGDYMLEDGRMLVVKEEGIIAEVKEKADEEEEEVVEEEARSEEEKDKYEEEVATPKKIVDTISKETFFSEIEQLKTENNNLKKELEELKLKSTENTTDVELSTEEEPKPIVHNPENKTKKFEGYKYSQNRMETTLDRVMNRLSK